MFEEAGMWWPDMPSGAGLPQAFINSAEEMAPAISYAKKRDVAVQAGGHCGEWALWLADRFTTVYTFEPDALNFACLTRNVAKRSNIFAARGFLADVRGPIRLVQSFANSLGGCHHGVSAPGTTPVYRIDDLALPACDVLILDVEGMELAALRGAAETIERFKPVIHLENNPEWDQYGWGNHAEIRKFLQGYVEATKVGYQDVVLIAR